MKRKILSAKLLMPKPRKGYIVREGLFRQLNELVSKRLTVILGGPGSGKTTLLTSYIQEMGMDAHWVSLDSECNHLFLFWEYVIQSLSGLFEKSMGDCAVLLQAGAGRDIKEILKTLLNAIDRSGDIVLVLDDFHLIGDRELLRSFAYFLENLPACVHVVLLSRERPDMYLAGFAMRGELLYLDEGNLKLTDEEGLRFLRQTLSLSLPDEARPALVRTAGGWIGGLQLLAAATGEKTTVKQGHSRIRAELLHAYISKEIFDGLTQGERDFLTLTAAAPYFNGDVAQSLLPDIPYADMLAALLHRNLLLQCIDEERGLYQYHNLFREYLLARFAEAGDEVQARCHRKLARVFHEMGDEDESLRQLLLLKDYSLAMHRILELPMGPLYCKYIAKIPVEQAVCNFDFAFQKFYYHYYIYDYDTCDVLYSRAMLHRDADKRFEAFVGFPQIYGREAFHLYSGVYLPRQLRDIKMLPLTRAMVLTKNAAFLFHRGRYTDALESVEEGLACEAQLPGVYLHYFGLTLKTQICEEMGVFQTALAVQEQAHRLMEGNRMLRQLHAPTFFLTAAGLYMKQMCLREAGEVLDACAETIAARGGQLKLSYDYNRAAYLFLTGKTDQAADVLGELMTTESYRDILMVSSLLKQLYHAGAMTPALQDRFMSACEEKQKEQRPMDGRLLYARIKADRGERQQSLSELDDLLQIARKQGLYLKIVEAALQRLSVMAGYSNDMRRLMDLYREALYHACDNQICMPFFMESGTIAALYRQYGNALFGKLSGTEKAFHWEMMRRYVQRDNGMLSEREREILDLVAEGLSNAGVAQRLSIAVPTVKTHVSGIFRKLEVHTRLEAVAKARRMGLIRE